MSFGKLSHRFSVRIVAVQFDITWEDKRANFAKVQTLCDQAEIAPSSLVCLPEMFATGFSMDVEKIAETYGGETEQFLSGLALRFRCFVLAGAAMRGRDGKARNEALLFNPEGKLAGYYAKMRPFTPGGEKEHYTAGERVTVVSVGEIRISPFVCYDLRFPELFRRAAAQAQPELFAVIANFPEKRAQHWVMLLQARAIENQAYVVGVNRIGADPFYTYSGRSIVVNPQGEIVADAGGQEGWISAALDLENLRKYRNGLPFLKDLAL
jgi:omega-amidase